MAATRLLLCGSRTWRDDDPIKAVLGLYMVADQRPVVIHGAAKGADSLAGWYAHDLGLDVIEFPADWKRHGKRAGYLRNVRMLDEGRPDVVWAFVDKPWLESKGTSHTVVEARKRNIQTYVIEAARVTTDEGGQ